MSHVDMESYNNNQKETVSMSLNSIECPVSIGVSYSCSKGNGKKLNLTKRLGRILILRLHELMYNSILPNCLLTFWYQL